MFSFFRGWRRKTGVLTLVVALVFTSGRVRCFYREDWRFVRFGTTYYLLRSDHGGFSCNRWDAPLPKLVALHGSQPVVQVAILATGPASHDDFFVYYSAVAIPLSLLSVYLLLMPRVS